MLTRFLSLSLAGLFLSIALSGCVSTGGAHRTVDIDKAVQTHVQLGIRYLQSGDNRDAARYHFNEALKLGGKRNPQAQHGLALLYQADGENKAAEEHFKKALHYDSDFSMARTNYGVFLYQQERYKEALEQFEIAAGDLSYNRRSFALANYGRCALKLGMADKAEQAYTRALALDKDMPQALLELAELKFDAGAYTQAKQYLDRYSAANRQVPRSLWLGIRIEKIFGNRDKERSYALALKNLFPYSAETLKYKQTMANDDG